MTALFPFAFLVVVAPLIVLATVICVLVVEKRGTTSWAEPLAWALLALVLPIVGFALWLVWTVSVKRVLVCRAPGCPGKVEPAQPENRSYTGRHGHSF